jgi:hypothetical protein
VLPMQLRVSGAVLSVTAVTGTGGVQLLTITATAVNGVVKTIVPGEAISVEQKAFYAL